jgi:hypothetical protein
MPDPPQPLYLQHISSETDKHAHATPPNLQTDKTRMLEMFSQQGEKVRRGAAVAIAEHAESSLLYSPGLGPQPLTASPQKPG